MHPVRRKDRIIPAEEVVEILTAGEYGYLATVDEHGQPYGIPLSYVYWQQAIYFHCALTGHKLDNLAQQSKVSFCVVGKTKVLPDRFGTEYESAVIIGVAGEVHGEERQAALVALLEKYCRDYLEEGRRYIKNKEKATRVFRITVASLSGKARKPL